MDGNKSNETTDAMGGKDEKGEGKLDPFPDASAMNVSGVSAVAITAEEGNEEEMEKKNRGEECGDRE